MPCARTVSMALCALLVACGSKTTGSGSGGSSSHGSSTSNGSSAATSSASTGAGSDNFPASGTFSVTGANPASATLTKFESSMSGVASPSTVTEISIAAVNGDGMSSATFTTPAGITVYTFTANVYVAGVPTAGSKYSDKQSCGQVAFSYGTAAKPFKYSLQALAKGANCSTVNSTSGSWSLSFTSVTPLPGVGSNYTAHGTLTATMPDGTGDTGSLNLTF